MVNFSEIRSRAAERKGGDEILVSLLPDVADPSALSDLPDDRALAEMTKCIFRSGFSWKVIESKWPDFETVFHGFTPQRLVFEPDEYWDGLVSDKRIVRHGGKIQAVRHNAGFVSDIAAEHGRFGSFAGAWPDDDIVGLWSLLAKRGKRLGGNTGRYFLRFIGKDSFLPSGDVVSALRAHGLEIAENPTSKRDPCRSSSTPGATRPACPTPTCHAYAQCLQAKTMIAKRCAAAVSLMTAIRASIALTLASKRISTGLIWPNN